MARPSKYSPEVRERFVRLVQEHSAEHGSQWAAIAAMAPKIGCTTETLRRWVRQAERDAGQRVGCGNPVTPPDRIRERHRRDDRGAENEHRRTPRLWQPAFVAPVTRAPALDVACDRCTSRQRNTHSTEAREVRYPWHPWFGRSVMVYEALTKGGDAICRCGFDDEPQ